jgi:hypothetical protein
MRTLQHALDNRQQLLKSLKSSLLFLLNGDNAGYIAPDRQAP